MTQDKTRTAFAAWYEKEFGHKPPSVLNCPVHKNKQYGNSQAEYSWLGYSAHAAETEALIEGLVGVVTDVDYTLRNVWALDRKKFEEEILPRSQQALQRVEAYRGKE